MQQLEENVDSFRDDPTFHFNMGVLLWERNEESQGSKEKAVEQFMMAVKLNPQNAEAFRYLGHYYASVSPEPQRALKCYQRAVSINPDDYEAGEAICDLLDKGGKESLILSISCEASQRSARAFWAFRRLGYLQAHQKKWPEAIQSLQHAIRGFPICADLWETLGLAYQRMGMFTAALKSYSKAVKLEESRIFALVESGNISLMLGSFRKGVEHFKHALRISPHNVAANFGLASALLGLAKECSNVGAFVWGAILLEEASEVATLGTTLAGNMPCFWKLHGDIQLIYARCFPWMGETKFSLADTAAFSSSIRSWRSTRFLAASRASRFYQRALHLAPWQANLYTDVAIALDLSFSLKSHPKQDPNEWSVAEKMCFGSILFEGHNDEFWVALGCLSNHIALKQHAYIRGLHLDISLAVAWAYLGKLYRQEGELLLAQKAFNRARSIDPSLGLPWAGMAADAVGRYLNQNEAYECCLRAVQIIPLAEFQLGLAKIAVQSDHLPSSEVFGAIQQAVLRAPEYPESHNLNGLVYESRSDYEKAITSYRFARCAITYMAVEPEPCLKDISLNLARSLCMAGHASDAVKECEYLRQIGQLGSEGLHIYTLCLWQLSKYDMALSMARELGSDILSMEKNIAAASISFICRLLYYISGPESTTTRILKMPKELFHSSKISFIVSAINVLNQEDQLATVVSSCRSFVTSYEDVIEMHLLIALGKLVKNQPKNCLAIHRGVNHLRKALHMYPSSSALRNFLSHLLVSSKEQRDLHLATRCPVLDSADHFNNDGMKSAWGSLGAGTVACYDIRNCNTKSSVLNCPYQVPFQTGIIQLLQKVLHQEPWNFNARYLLTLTYLQMAREARFPRHISCVLDRMTAVALSPLSQLYSNRILGFRHQHFLLLLCKAEVNLQLGNYGECLRHARSALDISVHNSCLFFAHLLLCRAHAAEKDIVSLRNEYRHCLELRTDFHIGWICLMFIKSTYKLPNDPATPDISFEDCFKDTDLSWNIWMPRFNLAQGLIALWFGDLVCAEEFVSHACSIADGETCLFLCHGAICMELARQRCESQYISHAIRSLRKAKETSQGPFPIVSMLLGQAEASLGSKVKWGNSLHDEWLSWNSETRPAEVLFQMHLVSRKLTDASKSSAYEGSGGGSLSWILRAIHVNPLCVRYWKFLQKECQDLDQTFM